jgi:Fe-S-cluster containining protein
MDGEKEVKCFDCKKIHPKCKAACCGVVPIPRDIYFANQDKIVREPKETIDLGDIVISHTDDLYCVFLNSDLSCNIYDQRPLICRKFGDESHPMMCCSFMDKDGRERSRQAKRRIERQSEKFINKLRVI